MHRAAAVADLNRKWCLHNPKAECASLRKTLTCDVVGRVDHLAHDAGEGGLGERPQVQPPGGHGRRVEEDVVHERDVQRHPRGQHHARLRLKNGEGELFAILFGGYSYSRLPIHAATMST